MLDSWQLLDQNRPCSLAPISNIYNLFSCSLCSIQERGYQPNFPTIYSKSQISFISSRSAAWADCITKLLYLLGTVPDLSWHAFCIERSSCCSRGSQLLSPFPRAFPLVPSTTNLFVLPSSQGQFLIYGCPPRGLEISKDALCQECFPQLERARWVSGLQWRTAFGTKRFCFSLTKMYFFVMLQPH